jgi:P-type conjugative transfer protein TrbJ
MVKRVAAVVAVLSVLSLTVVVAPAPVEAQFAVIDAANLVQQLLHYLQRLYEIIQKAAQLVAMVRELEYWYQMLEDLPHSPYRDTILGVLDGIDELMRTYQAGRGQVQALSYAVEEVEAEFDATFAAWKGLASLGEGGSYSVTTGEGVYSFEAPADYLSWQRRRVWQAQRQALKVSRQQNADLLAAEHWLNFGPGALTALAQGAGGTQQALEYSAGMQALTAQQLLALRNQVVTEGSARMAAEGLRVDQEMQAFATAEEVGERLRDRSIARYGSADPDPQSGPTYLPFPTWMN